MHVRRAVLLALLAATPLAAQSPPGWGEATAAFDRYVASDSIVGASLVYFVDGRIVAEHDMGWQDRDAQVPADSNTIWHWGSITKTLTAAAFMQVNRWTHIDRGVVDGVPVTSAPIAASVAEVIPEFRRIHDPFGSIDSVTFRMLLSHSSGLQNPTWPWGGSEPWQPFEPTEWSQLVAMMPYQQLRFAPGSRYSYSNPGFLYIARALEQWTGTPWQGLIFKEFFEPLGMRASYFGRTPRYLIPHRSFNYAVTDSGVKSRGFDFDPGITIPNGGWNAPVTDLVRWLSFVAGSADSATQARYDVLLPRSVFEEMWQSFKRVDDQEWMGLSFFLRHEGGRRLVGHTGTQANFRSFFWLDPDRHVGVLGVVNTSSDVDGAGTNARYARVMAAARAVLAR